MINEVMYNPEENDNYNEWIELYNPTNKSVNVTGWSIADNYAKDFLEGDFDHGNGTTIIPPYSYAIIADHGTKIYENLSIPNSTIRLYVDDSSIGNGMGNNGDKLILKNTTGNTIDDVEWINNYTDIPGMPAYSIEEGCSLSRYQNVDTNDSSKDFYEGVIPTPGKENIFVQGSNLDIELYPLYIPKTWNNSEYSFPFAIKINMSNYDSDESYQLKSYVVGNLSSSWPATQTWDGTSWMYSNLYTSIITTDSNGSWSDWQYLRFKKDYKEYERNIKDNNIAYLKVKIKKDNISDETSKEIYLLDMDNSTSNGTNGGYVTGIAKENITVLENRIVVIKNKSGVITGVYVTENNEIDEGFISTSGYYRVTSPVGADYKIRFLHKNWSKLPTLFNAEIKQGKHGVDVNSEEKSFLVRKNETLDIPLTVKNIGDFYDILHINIDYARSGWYAVLEKEKISLNPGETYDVNLHVTPCQQNGCISGSVIVSVTSEKDIGVSDKITLYFDILAPDLTIKNIKFYDEDNNENNVFGQGETIKIKAFFKNIGNENATNAKVSFYLDNIDVDSYLGCKYYESVWKYQKYPSIKWDTQRVLPGKHTLIVIADEDNNIDEIDEYNNKLTTQIEIFDTLPNKIGRSLLITEVYYHSRPGLFNEFIAIYNPSDVDFNLSGWHITNNPNKIKTEQTKIVFPNNTIIKANSKLFLSENAINYNWETGYFPDFEYNVDSDIFVPQMFSSKKFIMSNKGCMIALKDSYNHTIDLVIYGNISRSHICWNGPTIADSGQGNILKRNNNDFYVDTNTSNDWIQNRTYRIGQSDFTIEKISFYGKIKTFVSPDCSFNTVVNEIRNANESIYLNIYEFTSSFLCDELIKALLREVPVNIFIEGSPVGGISDEEKLVLSRIKNYGGKIRFIVSDTKNDIYARYRFNHAKYLIIDNETVIVESCNWANTGLPKNPTFGNREWGVVIENKSVAKYFLNVFFDDWDPYRCDSISFDDMGFNLSFDYFLDEKNYSGCYKPSFESMCLQDNFSVIPVFSPDTSYKAVCNLIDSANESIYVEQLYIYKDWDDKINPFVEKLISKSMDGVDVKVILNYNPQYDTTNERINQTKCFFEKNNVEVKFVYTNWSYLTNVHNKGVIVDNKSVLISSINWNENSVTNNREAGVIIENEEIAQYYADVFFYDWNLASPKIEKQDEDVIVSDYKNTIYIAVIFTMTFALIARDWRKRKWV